MSGKHIQGLQKSPVLRGALLIFPFLLILVVFTLADLYAWELIQNRYPAFSLIVRSHHQAVSPTSSEPPVDPGPDEPAFTPVYYLDQQWATLNVDGWKKRDIPVIFGESKAALKKGAGTWAGSRFCGQDGKLVISAHVTTWFYELETTPVGTEITMETEYGTYVYRVKETLVFEETDHTVLQNTDGEEVLVLYTCYPRSVGYRRTRQRMALICEMVEGKTWVER